MTKKYFKRITILTFSMLLMTVIVGIRVKAQEYRTDPECILFIAQNPIDGDPPCNDYCDALIIENGYNCTFGNPGGQFDLDNLDNSELLERTNVFGFDLGPADKAFPRLVRLVMFAMLSFVGLASMGYGFYGAYVRSTALDSPDKVELANKIFKNAVLGVLIAFGGVIILQILALVIGIEDNLTSFNVIPKRGNFVSITREDVENGFCLEEQLGYLDTGGGTEDEYRCEDGRWIPN
ncbi:hypothetical protein KC909_02915 [Candidatus Dojkabacteria bacterium]|uniref:Uncharacterized protein n=1 Tax=Candidatus Dojkabacteria bacterium TaxID=2099670 RepID=A0A955RIV5_9BACT|nr:hypothetical protein [Candidatus Dojkabacteria bacterium]